MLNIPAAAMKMKRSEKSQMGTQPHAVPLARQVDEVLRKLKQVIGRGEYVYAIRSGSRTISANTVNVGIRTLGWDADTVTGYGFRARARTMIHETLGFSPDAIEVQVAHRVPDRLGSAFNRIQHLEKRKRMIQAWADYLGGLRADGNDSVFL